MYMIIVAASGWLLSGRGERCTSANNSKISFYWYSLASSAVDRHVFILRELATEANELAIDRTSFFRCLEAIVIGDLSQNPGARQSRVRQADAAIGFGVEYEELSGVGSPAIPSGLVAGAASTRISGISKLSPVGHHLIGKNPSSG